MPVDLARAILNPATPRRKGRPTKIVSLLIAQARLAVKAERARKRTEKKAQARPATKKKLSATQRAAKKLVELRGAAMKITTVAISLPVSQPEALATNAVSPERASGACEAA